MIRRELRAPERDLRVTSTFSARVAPLPAATRRAMVWQACINLHSHRIAATLLLGTAALAGGCSDAETIFVPTVYVVAGRVADPTQNPIAGVPGARLTVETAPDVADVSSDSNGDFILQGVPPGTHRLRADMPGHVSTITYDFVVAANVIDAFVPIFTPAQVDSVLTARGAPAWDRQQGLFGLFALKSTGVPLGDAVASFTPSPGGTLVQTGEGADPIVVVNGSSGAYQLSVARGGYVWDHPYGVTLRPNVLTFAAPRSRPNFNGFVFAHLPSGPPVDGAIVAALPASGDAATGSATTNFIGQFSIVGLPRATYTARITAPGFLPMLSFPQPLDQDTTLAAVAFTADSLAAWASAAAAAAPTPGLGTIVIDVRDMRSGAPIPGATVEVVNAGGRSIAQTDRALALRLDLPAGRYAVFARAPGYAESVALADSRIEADAVTFGTVSLELLAFAVRGKRLRN